MVYKMRYVGSRELKKILGVTNQTVYNWRKAGKISFKQVNKRNFVYDIDSVLNQNLMSTKQVIAYCRVLNSTSETTFEQELMQGLISIIHHFSMKMCSNRRQKFKELARKLENEND